MAENDNNSRNDNRVTEAERGPVGHADESDVCTAEEALQSIGVGLFQVKLVVLSGFVWMARGFEAVVQRSIPTMLACSWELRKWQGALMTTITLLATILGCFLYGIWSDKYGRRTALSSSLIFLFVFTAVSAGLPSYTWFVIFRAVAGFATGGLPQTLVLCCEYMPCRKRGRIIYILSCFWALGVLLMLTLMFYTLESAGKWRVFVAVGTLPAFLAMIMMRFFPESFRFLLVSNHYIAANEIMIEMAEANKKTLGRHLRPIPGNKPRGRIFELFSKHFSRSTVFLWFMGLTTTISFLGLQSISTVLLTDGKINLWEPIQTTAMNFVGDMQSLIPCKRAISTDDFIFSVWTTALDFPGFVIFMILVDVIDHRQLLYAAYFLSSLFIFLLLIPSSEIMMYVCFIYVARTLLLSQFELLLLTAAEIFPTTNRGTGVGVEAASLYLGYFLSSYIVQGLMSLGILFPIIMYGILTLCCSIASFFLNLETRGKELKDVHR